MRQLVFFLNLTLFFISCKKESKKTYLLESNGAINSVTFVAKDSLLDGRIMDIAKRNLTKEMEGLPAPEQILDLHPLPLKAFEGFSMRSRNLIIVEINSKSGIFYIDDKFAKPQKVIYIRGKSEAEIAQILNENTMQIIDTIKAFDIKEKRRRILISPNKETILKDSIGISLKMPSVYYIGSARKGHFFWATRNISKGMAHLLVYEVPKSTIDTSDSLALRKSILKLRDSMGKNNIPGREKYMYYTTAKLPLITKDIQIKGRKSYETRGLWEMTNFAMGGPFINYVIEDLERNRYIIIEGFVYAPQQSKRNAIFEIETIAKSIKFH